MDMCIKRSCYSLTSHLIPRYPRQLTISFTPVKTSIKNPTEQLKKSKHRCIELESKDWWSRTIHTKFANIRNPWKCWGNIDDLVTDFFKYKIHESWSRRKRDWQEPSSNEARSKPIRDSCAIHLAEIQTENHPNKKAV